MPVAGAPLVELEVTSTDHHSNFHSRVGVRCTIQMVLIMILRLRHPLKTIGKDETNATRTVCVFFLGQFKSGKA